MKVHYGAWIEGPLKEVLQDQRVRDEKLLVEVKEDSLARLIASEIGISPDRAKQVLHRVKEHVMHQVRNGNGRE